MTTTDKTTLAPAAVPGYEQLFLLRYGEIFLKKGNRRFFENRLTHEITRVISPLGGRVKRLRHRSLVRVPADHAVAAAERLGCVFGLTSFSPVASCPSEIEAIKETAVAVAADFLAHPAPGQGPPKTFRVKARRSDKRFPLTSPEVARAAADEVGRLVDLPADLKHADLCVSIEIGPGQSFVSARRLPGLGGLPVDSSGAVTLLLSGGIDSPVAGWLLAKRGCTLRPITFESPPYTGPEATEKVVDLCGRLARYHGPMTLRVSRFTQTQLDIQKRCPPKLAVVLYRRMMIRAAALAARADGALALGTGESLGQVASQTLENIAAIAAAMPADLPLLRPLLTYDKAETIALGERIGSYPISIRPHIDCCSLFVPKHPETRARLAHVEAAEEALGDLDARAAELVDNSELIEITDPFASV